MIVMDWFGDDNGFFTLAVWGKAEERVPVDADVLSGDDS
jgi:hypothetical protein